MKQSRSCHMNKASVDNIKVDPIVIDMPSMVAKFVRFESSKDGKHFYVVYEIEKLSKEDSNCWCAEEREKGL